MSRFSILFMIVVFSLSTTNAFGERKFPFGKDVLNAPFNRCHLLPIEAPPSGSETLMISDLTPGGSTFEILINEHGEANLQTLRVRSAAFKPKYKSPGVMEMPYRLMFLDDKGAEKTLTLKTAESLWGKPFGDRGNLEPAHQEALTFKLKSRAKSKNSPHFSPSEFRLDIVFDADGMPTSYRIRGEKIKDPKWNFVSEEYSSSNVH